MYREIEEMLAGCNLAVKGKNAKEKESISKACSRDQNEFRAKSRHPCVGEGLKP